MKHSSKHIWITMLSILTMLMSSYVSSAPAMALGSVQSVAKTLPDHATHQHAQTHIVSSSHHANQSQVACHSMTEHASSVYSIAYDSPTAVHCGDSGTTFDDCCISVCSSVSYPLDPSNGMPSSSSSLALHQSVKIGDKVSRIQSLLRPPSA